MAERKHRHLIDTVLTMLAHASMPLRFWDEAIRTVAYLINRLFTPTLSGLTPLEVLFHHKPNYKALKVFGSSCFPNLRPYNQHKVQLRSTKCTSLGHSLNHKGYKCLDSTGRIYI